MSPKAFSLHWEDRLNDYVTQLTWSPNGDVLAASSASGQVVLWSHGQTIDLFSDGSEDSVDCLGFSADGQYLAAAGQQGKVFIWSIGALAPSLAPSTEKPSENVGEKATDNSEQARQRPLVVLPKTQDWIDRLAWHPTLPWLAFGTGSHWQLWDISQAQLMTQQDFVNSSVLDIAWHPQGSQLAISGHHGVKVWDSSQWDSPPVLVAVPGASLSVAWSADGKYLASGNLDHTLTVADRETDSPWLMQGFPGKVRQVCWAPSAPNAVPLVAAACMEGVTLWRRQGESWQSEVLQQHRGIVRAIAFHSTQALLASAAQDGQLCLWNSAPAKRSKGAKKTSLQQTLKGVLQGFSALAWHPEGRYLAAGGDQGELLIWALSNRGKGFQ